MRKGQKHTEESKRKQSEKMKGKFEGNKNPFFGKKHSEETREYLSKVRKGKRMGKENPFFGKKHTDKSKRKISEAHKGRTQSEETRKKRSESHKGLSAGEKNPCWGKFKEENPNWRGGSFTSQGRRFVITDEGTYELDYRVKAEQILGRKLRTDEVVHHIDNNPLNNENTNLIICSRDYHTFIHHRMEEEYGKV